MQYSKFFDEIFNNLLFSTEEGLNKYLPYLVQHQQGVILSFTEELPKLEMAMQNPFINDPFKKTDDPEKMVAIIPLAGLLTREGSWWDYGTEEIADMINEAANNDAVKSIVLRTNCVGGTTASVFPMIEALDKCKKPKVMAVDNVSFSAAQLIGSHCDKIFATHKMCQVGSIGIQAEIADDSAMWEKYGIKRIVITPPESNWKNRTTKEAKAGKTKLLIEEELTPWANFFQAEMKKGRPALDENVEGILNGRTFFAFDAVNNGLIDGIRPMDEIIKYAFEFAERQKIENL